MEPAGTWSELSAEVTVLARGLAGIGLRPGGRLLIVMSGRSEQWLIDLAAAEIGAVPTTIDPAMRTEQLRHLARHAAPQVLVLEGATDLARWRPILPDLPSLRRIVLVDEPAPHELSLATLSLAHVRSAGLLTAPATGRSLPS